MLPLGKKYGEEGVNYFEGNERCMATARLDHKGTKRSSRCVVKLCLDAPGREIGGCYADFILYPGPVLFLQTFKGRMKEVTPTAVVVRVKKRVLPPFVGSFALPRFSISLTHARLAGQQSIHGVARVAAVFLATPHYRRN